MSAAKTIKLIKDKEVEYVDLRFTDPRGKLQHLTMDGKMVDEKMLNEGVFFDGSSIAGWKAINESDMILKPDLERQIIDPFTSHNTLVLFCDVLDAVKKDPYERDPRSIAKKAEVYLKKSGIGDKAYFGPEAEFFMFDDVRYAQGPEGGFYSIDSPECPWNTGVEEVGGNKAYKIGHKSGYFPAAPFDQDRDIRAEMVLAMQELGLTIEAQHHEVAPAQHEIDFKFDTMLKTADMLQHFKYVVRNVAQEYGKTATFMPKPMFADNGSGMHTHQSIWKDGQPLFAGDQYAGLSEMALYYIGGILKHAPALAAFTNPLTNSYKRLVPGFEAPINLAYSNRNRSATIRIPVADSPKGRRIEYRCPDSGANAYFAFPAIMMAGLDGVQNKIDPGEPMDVNIYDLPPEKLNKIGKMPSSLNEALDALKNDHEFLLKGEVFTKDVIEYWLDWKMEEVRAIDSRPHPHEFELYYHY